MDATRPHFQFPSAALALLLLGLMPVAGCSHAANTGQVTFQSRATGREFFQHFNSAYVSDNHEGEYDIVLLNDDAQLDRPQLSRAPLDPIKQAPLRQVLRLHVIWRVPVGHVARERSVTNATIDWCLFGNEQQRAGDLLRYEGAAYVRVTPQAGTSAVTIRDGQVHPTQSRGGVRDAIGPAVITGEISAIHNDSKVKEVVRELDAALQAAGTRPATRPE